MTAATFSTSIPLAATSVAIRMLELPFLKRRMATSLWCCDMSPCSPSARNPAFFSASAKSSTFTLVLQKIRQREGW